MRLPNTSFGLRRKGAQRDRGRLEAPRMLSQAEEMGLAPSRPGNLTPGPHRIPDLNLSIHPAVPSIERLPPSVKPAGSPVSSWPIMVSKSIACPASLHGHYSASNRTTRQSAPRIAFVLSPRGSVTCGLRLHRCQRFSCSIRPASSRFRPPVCRMPLRP